MSAMTGYAERIETEAITFKNTVSVDGKSTFRGNVNIAGNTFSNAILKYVYMTGTNVTPVDTNNIIGCVVWTNSAGASPSGGGGTNHRFKVTLSADQSVSATMYTKLLMSNVVYNVGGGWSVTNTRYTPPENGVYIFNAKLATVPDTELAVLPIIYTNGVEAVRGLSYQGYDQTPSLYQRGNGGLSVMLNLKTNDYVEIYAALQSESTIVSNQNLCWFEGTIISR